MATRLVKGRKARDPRSDSQLMIDLCDGDEDAFSEVIRRFQGPIYSLLIRMLGNEDEAEELLQETFCRLHRYRENYDPERPLVTWIFTIDSNLAKKRWRRRSRWSMIPLDYINLTNSRQTAPHYEAGRVELRATLEEAIEKLPPHYREPFLLREKNELTYEQIAEVLDIRIGTVKSRINRARSQLRDMLKDTWEQWK